MYYCRIFGYILFYLKINIYYRGREGKGGRNRQQSQTSTEDDKGQSVESKDVEGVNKTGNEKGKKGRPKSPCEAIESEPYINIEVVKYGRDPNNTFSSGTYLLFTFVNTFK